MKKVKFLFLGSLLAMVGLASCQGTEERACQDVADKIAANEELTNEDYTRMIEYVGEYAEKAQEFVVNDNSEQAAAQLEALNKEYPLVDTFRNCIRQTPVDKFDADNLQLLQKYGGLVEFTMPDGMTLQTDPNAAGMEVEAPTSDSTPDSGVIVGAVDELKVTDK